MKEKAEGELSEPLKAEDNTKQSVNILKQSLEGQTAAATENLDDQRSSRAAAEQTKATDEADLAITEKDLENSKLELAKTTSGCLTVAADHDATIASREEELTVIAECENILQEPTAGAVAQTYSFLQTATWI